MKKRLVAAWIAVGIVLGAGAVMAWDALILPFYPAWSPLEPSPQGLHDDHSLPSTTALARVLLDRVARTFVADSRPRWPLAAGVGFYTRPKAFGEALCQIDVVSVPGKIVRGGAARAQGGRDDDISILTMYGVWKKPGIVGGSGIADDAACSRFRDFDHLISGDGLAVERGVNMVYSVIDLVKAGRINFNVTCVDQRQDRPVRCDGAALIRTMDPKEISQIDNIEETSTSGSAHHVDEVVLRQRGRGSCGLEEMLTLKIGSTQVYGRHTAWQGDPTSVDLERSVIC